MRRIVKAGLEPILKFNATPLFDATRYNAPAAILLGVTKSKLELEEDNQKLVRSLKEKVGYKEQSGIMQSMKTFQKLGKLFRPAVLTTLGNALYCSRHPNEPNYNSSVEANKTKLFSACIEVTHNCSLMQDDIIGQCASCYGG